MSGPDRIFAKSWMHATHTEVGVWSATHHVGTVEYIRRDPVVLAALPEVQALIAEAVAKEREACARMVDCGCDKGQKAAVIDAENYADRTRTCGQYNCGAEDAAAIRKRGEG